SCRWPPRSWRCWATASSRCSRAAAADRLAHQTVYWIGHRPQGGRHLEWAGRLGFSGDSISFITRVLGAVLFAVALSPAVQASTEQEAANKAAVLAFYEKGLNQKDADAAVKYLGDRYIQHNPNAAD
ncbi:nuclear transport factor 2 family protein, partial [Escherichia coli]|uniref:nuclear transport factor 2 family protein n=1 Tax=Escherichia coli TaxID=562 RepID=UPI003D2F090F